jgi:uncharacterized SAM-binding protein YcdF (DUF218 family)
MQALTNLTVPSNVVLLLGVAGIILQARARWRRLAPFLLCAVPVLLLILSSEKVATLLLSPLEYAYPKAPAFDPAAQPAVIVVLAAYAADDANMPLSARPNPPALFRIVEAVHLWRACQRCTVIVSGTNPTAKVMAESLAALAVPDAQIRIDSNAANTAASAVNVRQMIGADAFYLVTSAGHMPRSMGVFLKQGLRPIPAPTEYSVPKSVVNASWSPSSQSLFFSDLAVHEHIGILWYRLTGRI